MDLFVIRHAIAAPPSPECTDDERPLTRAGRRKFRRCVRGMERLGYGFERLLHGPALRAVQTADELARLLDGESAVTPHLGGPPTAALLEELGASGERVACVGHEPWLGEVVTHLLGAGGAAVALKRGGVAHLRGTLERGGMQLLELLTPRVLVRIQD